MHRVDEVSDRPVRLQIMPERSVELHAVAVAPPVALTFEHSASFKFGEDFHHGALGDAHLVREVAHAEGIIRGEAEKHVGMVGEERPAGGGRNFF